MKCLWYLVSVVFVIGIKGSVLTAERVKQDKLPLAKPCDPEACQLPDCRCSTYDVPGGLDPKNVPQFVLVTFDDGVNVVNINTYREIIYNRRNSNGCRAGATFYISHEYTDYTLVNELYNRGLEIALHSVSHQNKQEYWKDAAYSDMEMEFGDQRSQMSHFANIPLDAIKGIRMPFLQMAGNASFQVMSDYGLEYDCSWPTNHHVDPGLWPYTLDYASTQECVIPPCPTASIPGTWVLPMVGWLDLNGRACSMIETCYTVLILWYLFHETQHQEIPSTGPTSLTSNFARHYFGNRSPFGFFVHEWYIARSTNPAIHRAFLRFMDMINQMDDVFMVNSADAIDWVKNPVPLDTYKQRPCKTVTPASCPSKSCGPLNSVNNEWSSYWMQVCNECPIVYPTVGNPLGH